MQNITSKNPYLALLRKHKVFLNIPSDELQAATKELPAGTNGIRAMMDASREYQAEVKQEARKTGVRPAVCFSTDCDDDHCRCWDEE